MRACYLFFSLNGTFLFFFERHNLAEDAWSSPTIPTHEGEFLGANREREKQRICNKLSQGLEGWPAPSIMKEGFEIQAPRKSFFSLHS